jgi:hypothetical protein
LDKSPPFISPLPQSSQIFVLAKSLSGRVNWNWVRALSIFGLHFIIFCSLPPAFANQELTGPPWSFLEQHREQILQLSSDGAALAFFQSITTPKKQISRTRTNSPSSSKNINPSEEVKEAVILYLASLAVTAHARTIQKNIVQPSPANPPASEVIPGEPQLQWMMEQPPLQTLKPMMDFYTQVSTWAQTASQSHPSGNDYAAFASYYDQTYPHWDDSPLSWTNLYYLHGRKGIEARLLEYWQTPDHPTDQHPSPSTKNAYAQYYIGTRLLPMFRANLLTQSIQVETMAYETAWKSWHNIQEWQQQEQTKSAAARLCGTWQWLVHNHQNHGDHKMTITFSSLEQSSPSQPKPTIIAIQGDTVYLKWTFPQGFQEDSLLLSNHDTHLEGTFKNSLGPHGSISGKRLSSCQS